VSHELRTPLTVIAGSLGLLTGCDVERHADPMRLLKMAQANCQRLLRLVDDILVTVEAWNDRVCIAVHDHDPGIPDEFKARAFEKFVQVDASDARQRGGTGLGLSIVKLLMSRLGGDVSHNAAEDGGTIFRIDLPRGDARATTDCYRATLPAGTDRSASPSR
jgi:signal transduction histidine kinase